MLLRGEDFSGALWPLTAKTHTSWTKRQREKNAVEQPAGRETAGGDKGGLTCFAIAQTAVM